MQQEQYHLGPLAVWHHKPESTVEHRARVLLIHGVSEHSGRHLNTIQALLNLGHEVVRFDLRGAGHSGGERQWVERFEDYVEDTATVHNWIRRTLPPLPQFVLGHSMGGAIGFYFVSEYQNELKGYIASAPAYLTGASYSPLTIAVGKLFCRVAPTFKVYRPKRPVDVSRDEAVVDAYANDALSGKFNTLQQGSVVLDALAKIPSLLSRIELPVTILHGSADRIIKMEGSFTILRGLSSADRTLHIFPNGYHELHNDLDKAEFFRLVGHWIQKHL